MNIQLHHRKVSIWTKNRLNAGTFWDVTHYPKSGFWIKKKKGQTEIKHKCPSTGFLQQSPPCIFLFVYGVLFDIGMFRKHKQTLNKEITIKGFILYYKTKLDLLLIPFLTCMTMFFLLRHFKDCTDVTMSFEWSLFGSTAFFCQINSWIILVFQKPFPLPPLFLADRTGNASGGRSIQIHYFGESTNITQWKHTKSRSSAFKNFSE